MIRLSNIFWLTVLVSSTVVADDNEPVDFSRQILPVLSSKCFVCHGPDTQDDSLVRLDTFVNATKAFDGHQAIDPKNPSNSEILKRIHSDDDPMPPADAPWVAATRRGQHTSLQCPEATRTTC